MVQKEVFFDETKETFESTYKSLNHEILELLKNNWKQISEWKFKAYQQNGKGTYHTRKHYNERFPFIN